MKIEIVEVGPRDGLQNESEKLTLDEREWLVTALAQAGLRRIEAGAFVSEKWVPQMANSGELFSRLGRSAKLKGVRLSALVPNSRGMQDALTAQVDEVAVFGACSETFSRKNINCSIAESFERFREVKKMARAKRLKVRGYLSTVFGCPYEGEVELSRVVKLTKDLLALGVYEVSLGDTIGVATPKQVEMLLKKLKGHVSFKKIALHFHDTRGTALANVLQGLRMGVRIFDSSVGGLGGCPYAKGASGNLATEDLVYMLDGMGIETGVDFDRLISMRSKLESMVRRALPARSSLAGRGSFDSK